MLLYVSLLTVNCVTLCVVLETSNPDMIMRNRLWIFICSIREWGLVLFSCDQAALWMVQSVCLSVRPSVCLSVRRPSHLFDYVPIIVSTWNFQELLPVTEVKSMQKVKVKGQGHRGHNPTLPFPDCNSSLNSPMATKCCTKLEVA